MDLTLYQQFKLNKAGVTGLTVTVDVDRIHRKTGARSAVVTGASATEGIRGYYRYKIANADPATYDYVGIFICSNSALVEDNELPAMQADFSPAAMLNLALPQRTRFVDLLRGPAVGSAFSAAELRDLVAEHRRRLGHVHEIPAGTTIASRIAVGAPWDVFMIGGDHSAEAGTLVFPPRSLVIGDPANGATIGSVIDVQGPIILSGLAFAGDGGVDSSAAFSGDVLIVGCTIGDLGEAAPVNGRCVWIRNGDAWRIIGTGMGTLNDTTLGAVVIAQAGCDVELHGCPVQAESGDPGEAAVAVDILDTATSGTVKIFQGSLSAAEGAANYAIHTDASAGVVVTTFDTTRTGTLNVGGGSVTENAALTDSLAEALSDGMTFTADAAVGDLPANFAKVGVTVIGGTTGYLYLDLGHVTGQLGPANFSAAIQASGNWMTALPAQIPATWIGTGAGQISIANGVVAASGAWATVNPNNEGITAAAEAAAAAALAAGAAQSAAQSAATNTASLPAMIEDGKFTVSALSNAPAGEGGGTTITIESTES